MHSHDLALLLLEWPKGNIIIEHEEKLYFQTDVEVDLDGDIHLVARGEAIDS